MSKRSPGGKWEDEFYSSQLYQMLHKVKIDDVEKSVSKAINAVETTVKKAENAAARPLRFPSLRFPPLNFPPKY